MGPWTPAEVNLVTGVLDQYSATLGAARFSALVEAAVVTATNGQRLHLTFIRGSGTGAPPAGWMPPAGAIVVNNSLFDAQYLEALYNWGVLAGTQDRPPAGISIQQAIMGHELGHVLIDGLRAEVAEGRVAPLPLEGLYVAEIPKAERAHPDAPPNESLATELGLWAYGISRPAEAEAFLQHVLIAAIEDVRVMW